MKRTATSLIFLIFIGFSIFTSCLQDKRVIEKKQSEETIIGLERDTMSIKIDNTSLHNYHTQVSFGSHKNDYLIGYNDKTHCLNIFDFTNKTVGNIKLYREGQGAVSGQVNGLYATSLDSIWILANRTVCLLDSNGMVKERYDLIVDDGEFLINTSNYSNASIKLYFDADKRMLYYVTVKMGDKVVFYINALNLDGEKVRKTELGYTEAEQGVGQKYGWMQHPNITYNGHLVIYNFPFNSNVYTMDLHTGMMKCYGGESRYTRNMASEELSQTMDGWYKHMIENVHFYEINYDPYNKRYYRLHLNGIDFSPDMAVDKQLFNRELFLTVFDRNFNVIDEFPLSNDLYNINGGWGVFENGFFMVKDHPNMEQSGDERLYYDMFHFK